MDRLSKNYNLPLFEERYEIIGIRKGKKEKTDTCVPVFCNQTNSN